jgi:hypothetical protein
MFVMVAMHRRQAVPHPPLWASGKKESVKQTPLKLTVLIWYPSSMASAAMHRLLVL